MRHQLKKRSSFGLKPGPRLALIRNLVSSLVEHERIKTTLPRAQEVRRRVERAITIGRKENLSARRVLLSRFPNKKTVSKIMNQLAVQFKERPGGFTRIIKLGKRSGDSAEMAYIELVNYDPLKAKPSEKSSKKEKDQKPAAKKKSKQGKITFKLKKKKKKHLRKVKALSRRTNRSV